MLRLPILRCVCVLLLGACGASDEGSAIGVCVESACPDDQVCGTDGCEPIPVPVVTGALGRFTRSAMTRDGTRVIATYDSTHRNLVVLFERPNDTVVTQVVDGWRVINRQTVEVDAGTWIDLAIDDEDGIHLVWHHADDGALRYGFSSGDGHWETETVDGKGSETRGTHASVAVADGRVHVAYRDVDGRSLRYARRESGGEWSSRQISSCAGELECPSADEDFGEWASVAVIGGRPRVAFYDRLRGDLKVTSVDVEGVWSTTTLDGRDPSTGLDTGDVGRFVTLVLDATRVPGLAYYDASRGALRFVRPGETPIVVDAGVYLDTATATMKSHPVGQHAALRYDAQGRAVLMYLDGGSPAIKIATVSDEAVRTIQTTNIPPGGFLNFEVVTDTEGRDFVEGVLGAWVAGEAPRSALDHFRIAMEAP
ncbi:MAG: hypothetical protein ACI9MR_004833 [Myxococcota bacterium]|jgi:hypothetical protein